MLIAKDRGILDEVREYARSKGFDSPEAFGYAANDVCMMKGTPSGIWSIRPYRFEWIASFTFTGEGFSSRSFERNTFRECIDAIG